MQRWSGLSSRDVNAPVRDAQRSDGDHVGSGLKEQVVTVLVEHRLRL